MEIYDRLDINKSRVVFALNQIDIIERGGSVCEDLINEKIDAVKNRFDAKIVIPYLTRKYMGSKTKNYNCGINRLKDAIESVVCGQI